MKCKLFLLLIILGGFTLNAQVVFNEVPKDKQLFGRDILTNYGEINIDGYVSIGPNYDLEFSNWSAGEPNNSPPPENAAEIVNSYGKWNDANENNTQDSYVEYEGEITSLGDFVYLGQFAGHSYFRNTQDLNWLDAKQAAENLGGYLASIHTSEESSAITSFGFFRGWIGLYQDIDDSNYSEPSGTWKWVSPTIYNETEYESLKVQLLRNGTIVENYTQELEYLEDIADFNFQIPILAELAKYRIKAFGYSESEEFLLHDADDLVAGDVYIIQGQSNAAALSYSGSSAMYQNEYIRVYSGGYTNSSDVLSDDQWYYAQGDGNENSGGNTGQWGLALAKMLKDQLNIPIAIFNGAHGGQPISFFERPENYQSSTDSNYGRLFYRLNKSKLKNYVRGILWSQGEADSFYNGLSTNEYKTAFESLISYWQEDFPAIEKYFIFQTRDCDCGTIFNGRKKIKEAQRQISLENENIFIMPTTGMQLHSDNCHFPFNNGYEKFATRIFPILINEIYGIATQDQILPPMVTNISFTDNIVELTTDAESLVQNSSINSYLINKLNEDFIFSDGSVITGFEINANKLIFQLSQTPSDNTKLSLIGISSYIQDNITNISGLEIIPFSDICISDNCNNLSESSTDENKPSGFVFTENGEGDTWFQQIYRRGESSPHGGGFTRGGNGNSNDNFGNIGNFAADLTVSDRTPESAAQSFGGFQENGHPLYNQGDGNWSIISEGHGAIGYMSFTANAYNRASGLGATALGFGTISGPQVGAAGGIDGGNVGQFSAGWASRAIGNISTATGFRNTAGGQSSVALGNYNYATGDSSIALGKENWAEGASTIAIGFKNHAAGGGSVALGQETVAWGTTNFTSGYQNVAGDTSSAAGTGGSATAMGKYNVASADASMALNRGTMATNQATTSMGLGTIADNVGMVAVGVNNAAGIGDTAEQYYYVDGQYTGANPGVAFVVGNGDINGSNGLRGDNPSNAFIVNYDGSATLAGDLTVNSDARLKSNIVSLGNTISKLLLIDGKTYTMKSNDAIEKIGLLAQEVQKAFPELVKQSGDEEGTLSVNYQGMIPVLINAIKEQQKDINEIKNKLKSS